jgi:hypothetical protein
MSDWDIRERSCDEFMTRQENDFLRRARLERARRQANDLEAGLARIGSIADTTLYARMVVEEQRRENEDRRVRQFFPWVQGLPFSPDPSPFPWCIRERDPFGTSQPL